MADAPVPTSSAFDDLKRLGLLAGGFGGSARVFHVGFVVPNLEEAIADMGEVLGVPFTPPTVLAFPELQTPEGPRSFPLRYAYSTRPLHVEFMEAVPGTLWDFNDGHRGIHLGVWTDDVAEEADRLATRGMPALWWGEYEGRKMFSFHLTKYGFYIELIDTYAKSFYPAWFAESDPEYYAVDQKSSSGE